MPRRDPASAPTGPAARSVTQALLDELDSVSEEYYISGPSGKSRTSKKARMDRKPRGRPPLHPDQKTNHVKTTFSLPPETIALIERLRRASELYAKGVPSKSEVVTEAVKRLGEALGVGDGSAEFWGP